MSFSNTWGTFLSLNEVPIVVWEEISFLISYDLKKIIGLPNSYCYMLKRRDYRRPNLHNRTQLFVSLLSFFSLYSIWRRASYRWFLSFSSREYMCPSNRFHLCLLIILNKTCWLLNMEKKKKLIAQFRSHGMTHSVDKFILVENEYCC